MLVQLFKEHNTSIKCPYQAALTSESLFVWAKMLSIVHVCAGILIDDLCRQHQLLHSALVHLVQTVTLEHGRT